MKIGILINDVTYPGGTEKITNTLSDVFCSKGNSVTIISCYKNFGDPAFQFNKAVKISYLRQCSNSRDKFVRIINYFLSVKLVKNIIRENKFDILLCQSFPMFLIGYMASRGTNTKVIACEHTSYDYYKPFIRKMTIKLYKKADSMVVINRTDAQKYSVSCKHVKYIPNIVEIESNPISIDSTKPHKLVAVGRLEYHKGFDRLILAMKDVIESHPEVILYLYGNGSEMRNLENLINKLGLTNNIELKGVSTDLNQIYLDKTIFILPSRIEGFGLVLVEAAHYGLPLIAFDCPNGPRDILNDNNGLLIDDGNIEDLSKAIIRLIEMPSEWLGYHHRSIALVKDYSKDAIYPMWKAIFKEVTAVS